MKIGVKIGAMSLGTLAILIIVGITAYFSVTKLIENNRDVLHSQKVLEALAVLHFQMVDSQSSARGYVVTGDDDYLDQFKTAQSNVTDSLKEIRKLTHDNQVQQQMLDNLDPEVDKALAEMKETMELCKVHGPEEALRRMRAGGPKNLMETIRRHMHEVANVEKKLLLDRTEDMTDSANNTKLTVIFGTILAIVFVSLCAYLITRDITGPIRVLVRASDNLARGRFDAVPRFNSQDEFEDLAAAFNQMGSSMRDFTERIEAERLRRTDLERLVDGLRLDLQKLGSRISDLVSAARQQIVGFEENPTPVATAIATAGGLSKSADELSALARSSAGVGKQCSHHCEVAVRSYQEAQSSVIVLAEKVKSAAIGVSALSERTEDMNEIVGVIESISAELNLVAMGAAMEVSRAGESAKGISPLVDQLRSLSDMAKQHSIKVNQTLSRIEKAATRAVISTEDANEAVEPALSNVSKVASDLESLGKATSDLEMTVVRVSEESGKHAAALGLTPHKIERVLSRLDSERTFIKQCELTAADIQATATHANELVSAPAPQHEEAPSLV